MTERDRLAEEFIKALPRESTTARHAFESGYDAAMKSGSVTALVTTLERIAFNDREMWCDNDSQIIALDALERFRQELK